MIQSFSQSWPRQLTSVVQVAAKSRGFWTLHTSPGHMSNLSATEAIRSCRAISSNILPSAIRARYVSTVSNYPKHLQHLAPPNFQWLRVFEVFPPFSARLRVHFPDDGRLWILNAASPISARKTRLFCPLARNFNKDGPLEELMAFNLQIFNEDRVIVESQRPEDLPLDLQMEVHIAADRTSIAYRKLLKSMGLGSMYTS
jgi:vanillate O-demethylase oxygenase-like protein